MQRWKKVAVGTLSAMTLGTGISVAAFASSPKATPAVHATVRSVAEREPAEHRALPRIEVCGGPPGALERICHDLGGIRRIDQDVVGQCVHGASVSLT